MVERQCPRFPAMLSGELVHSSRPHAIKSVDLSLKGCRLQNTVHVVPGMLVDLRLYAFGEKMPWLIQGAMVRWSNTQGIGIEFQHLPLNLQTRLELLVSQLAGRDN